MIKYIIFSLFLFFCSFSNAEDSLLTLKQQLDRLQREVNDLSKSVFTSKRDNYEQQVQSNSNFIFRSKSLQFICQVLIL